MYHQLIYRSRYRPGDKGVSSTVRDIIETSERNNLRDRITGYLVFDKTHFTQVLEGDEAVVERTLDRIVRDPRHEELIILARRPVEQRCFGDWSMGGAIRSPETEDIFRRHSLSSESQYDTADAILALAKAISEWENRRKQQRGLSAR